MEIPNPFQTLEQVHRVLLQPHWRKDLGAKGMNAQSNALRSGAGSIAPRFNRRTPPEEGMAVKLNRKLNRKPYRSPLIFDKVYD